jgi:hypothetical protein
MVEESRVPEVLSLAVPALRLKWTLRAFSLIVRRPYVINSTSEGMCSHNIFFLVL